MMFVDLQVTLGVDDKVDAAVLGNLLEHMVEEPETRRNVTAASTVETHLDGYVSLLGGTLHLCRALAGKK